MAGIKILLRGVLVLFSYSSFSDEFGTVVTSSQDDDFTAPAHADIDAIFERLKKTGFVYFDAAGVDQEAFEKIIDMFCLSDPGEHLSLQGYAARDVFTGKPALALHAEQKYLPWSPDFISFYCVEPALEGGQTTVADGLRFLKELSGPTRELFEREGIIFRHRMPKRLWQNTFHVGDKKSLKRFLKGSGVQYFYLPFKEILFIQYRAKAFTKTRYQHEDAFANTICHALDMGLYKLRLGNGKPIPQGIQQELEEVAEKVTHNIPWKAGDFAIIDNSRVMHGRRAYYDSQRLIKAKHGMSRFG
jgi:hypothetical protein